MKAYAQLISRVLKGYESKDRTGVGTVCLFGESLMLDLEESFPLVSMRRIQYKQALGELAGFLRGYTAKADFTRLGCTYWNTTGSSPSLGPIYGYQWRNWGGDQLANLIDALINDPFSRRHILSCWNVSDLKLMSLMPCHITAQFNVRENGPSRRMSLDCCVYIRSSDVMLGLPYDIVLYAVLQSLIADHCGYKACKLTFFFGNAHIYKNHVVEARKLLLTGPQLCSVELLLNKLESVTDFMPIDATILRYNPAPAVHFPLNL